MLLQLTLILIGAGALLLGAAGAVAYVHEVATTRADRAREAAQPATTGRFAPAPTTGTLAAIAALPDAFSAGCAAAERDLAAGLDRITGWAYRQLGVAGYVHEIDTMPATPAPDLLLEPGWLAATPMPGA